MLMQEISLFLGGAWASGVNLYLTMAGLGIAGRAGIIELPGTLDILSNPMVITVALLLFVIEFFADKVPYVDSAWDSAHTFIRPLGAAVMAYQGTAASPEAVQLCMALVGGTIALDSHATKATTRVAINTSPEPFSNITASLSEDSLVLVALWLIAKHPVVAGILVIAFIVFSVWFLKVMFKFFKKIFTSFKKKKESEELTVEPVDN